jgi:hypothetical protein
VTSLIVLVEEPRLPRVNLYSKSDEVPELFFFLGLLNSR